MRILNIVFGLLALLLLLNVSINLNPFKISWNPPVWLLLGWALLILGISLITYHHVKKARYEGYKQGMEDLVAEVKKRQAKVMDEHDASIEKIKNDTCATQMDIEQ